MRRCYGTMILALALCAEGASGQCTRAFVDANASGNNDGFADYQNDTGLNQVHWLNDAHLNLDVYRCPSDYGYTGHHYLAWRESRQTSYDHYGNSYVAAASFAGVSGKGCTLWSNSAFLRPLSRVPSPARTLLLQENCGRFGWRTNYGADGCGSLSGQLGIDVEGIIRGWHGTPFEFNVAFVDGHVARIYMNGHLQPQPDVGLYPEGTSYPYWHCVIFRGLDWQLDTLPAWPFPTNVPCPTGGIPVNPIG